MEMSTTQSISVAMLDDFQGVARTLVDWSTVSHRASLTFFHDHLADADAVV